MATRVASIRWRIVRALFEMLYRSRTLYWLASTIPFAGQWRRWQRLVLPRIAGTDVLEVGCGIGTLLGDMAEAGYACSAIDRSPQMVAAARGELRRRGFSDDVVRIVQSDVRRLPFPDASFDTVVSTFPTEYIYDSLALRDIRRVLRPGGRLVIVLGAGLEPATPLLLPLVALQTAVYGGRPRANAAPSGATDDDVGGPLRARIALAGLRPRGERVHGPFWQAYLVLAEKPAAGTA